jgi:hypothetical protein
MPAAVHVTGTAGASGSVAAQFDDGISPPGIYTNGSVTLMIADYAGQAYVTAMGSTAAVTAFGGTTNGTTTIGETSNPHTSYTEYLETFEWHWGISLIYNTSWTLDYTTSVGSGGSVSLSGEIGCDATAAFYLEAGPGLCMNQSDGGASGYAIGAVSLNFETANSGSGGGGQE